jgi:uncharacterized protein (DUF433 family)
MQGELIWNAWYYSITMNEQDVIRRLASDPAIFRGKPILRGRRLAVEHILSMLAAGDSAQDILTDYPFLEPDDIRACLLYAYKLVTEDVVNMVPGPKPQPL